MTVPSLPSVTRLSKRVVRVLGQNPGKFTLQGKPGTNTYLIGTSNPYTLIDTAEGRDEYTYILESSLREIAKPTNAHEPDVSDIIISHWHHDHVGGLDQVLNLLRRLWTERSDGLPYIPPRLHKYPLPQSYVPDESESLNLLPSLLTSISKELYTPNPNGSAFHDLHDGQVFSTPTTMHVLHTPGHTVDSISLYIPEERAFYTADTILGHGTSVFEDLAAYLESLDKMLRFVKTDEVADAGHILLYTGHGATIPDGKKVISMYIRHRLEREGQIITVLRGPASGDHSAHQASVVENWTTWNIVKILYASYDESLWQPAARGIHLHLKKLEAEGRVKQMGGEGVHTVWKLVMETSKGLCF